MIGFLDTLYTVGESDGQANVQIGVIRGSLQRPVVVEFSTNAVSAAGNLHKIDHVHAVSSKSFSSSHRWQ